MKITDIGTSCGIVYHYTTLAAALSIITPEGLKFHASRYDCMDDAYDSIYGFAAYQAILDKAKANLGANFDDNYCSPYVLSFSKKYDDLSMQRMFNAELVLHIDSDLLLMDALRKSNRVKGGDIMYLSEAGTKEFVDSTYNFYADDECQIEFDAFAKCSFLKHQQYGIEDEWRLSYYQDFSLATWDRTESLNGDDLSSEVRFKVVNGKIKMYRELTFTPYCLKGITVFEPSTPTKLRVRDSLVPWLAKNGYKNNDVELKSTETPMVNK